MKEIRWLPSRSCSLMEILDPHLTALSAQPYILQSHPYHAKLVLSDGANWSNRQGRLSSGKPSTVHFWQKSVAFLAWKIPRAHRKIFNDHNTQLNVLRLQQGNFIIDCYQLIILFHFCIADSWVMVLFLGKGFSKWSKTKNQHELHVHM